MTEVTLVIRFSPIGFVRNAIEQAHRHTRWEELESEIVIDERWRDALDGIAQFSHIWIIFYIGIRAVELIEVRDNVLRVRGLDALNGSPVLDLKPYLPRGDAIPDARVSDWVRECWTT
jgi:tRNA (Thr-GGU) A37 N-methylase